MIPDRDYPRVFHSPGLEPWILGLLIDARPRSILDVGCGYGFWGFVVRSRVSSVDYIVGLDLDFGRVVRAGGLYDGVVANAVFPPFREGVFDVVLAVEGLHGLKHGNTNWHACDSPEGIVVQEYGEPPTSLYMSRDGFSWIRILANVDVDPTSRHFHYVAYDPYRDLLYATLGDGNMVRAIAVRGASWRAIYRGPGSSY